MTVEAVTAFYQTLRDASLAFLLLLALVGNWRRIYYWRWQHDDALADRDRQIKELKEDRDEWKAMALHGTELAEHLVKAKGR